MLFRSADILGSIPIGILFMNESVLAFTAEQQIPKWILYLIHSFGAELFSFSQGFSANLTPVISGSEANSVALAYINC